VIAQALFTVALLSCPALAVDENPDAPVGVVGLEVFANRVLWEDYQLTLGAGMPGATILPNGAIRQEIVGVGANMIVPATSYMTIRVGAMRAGSTTEDEVVAEPSGAIVQIEENMQAWHLAGSVTFWFGSPTR